MKLSNLSIERPVLAVVMSLLLVALGAMSFFRLTLRELPDVDAPIVSVQVIYPGSSAAVVETRITQLMEDALAGIEGIDTISSTSSNGVSSVTVEFSIERDIEAAANDVRSAVGRIAGRMPEEADPPEIAKVEMDAEPILWMNLRSSTQDVLQLSDYAQRYLVDRFSSINGVAQIQFGGAQRYALRIWLNRQAMAARGVTATDVENALRRENVELPAGRIESLTRDFTLRIERGYRTPEQFAQIPIGSGVGEYIVRIGDISRIEFSSAERRAYSQSNNIPAVSLGIVRTSTANALDVARDVRAELERVVPTLPAGTELTTASDNTVFVEESLNRVYSTLVESMVLVFLVIWVFLGRFRAALIPAVTVPVCLIAAFIALDFFGFSINMLTLMALVLCIGLVVDDAIVVLENVQRRVDLGEPALVAAQRGTAQVGFAVIATTAVLVAVFVPVSFMEGNVGRLFRELSVALAAAVAISAFVALTLTPMLCSKLVNPDRGRSGFHALISGKLEQFSDAYARLVGRILALPRLALALTTVGVLFACLLSSAGLASRLKSELAPPEDRGIFFVQIQAPEGAGYDYTVSQVRTIENLLMPQVGEGKPLYRISSRVPGGPGLAEDMHLGRIAVQLQPWDLRTASSADVANSLRDDFEGIAGARVGVSLRTGLTRNRTAPLQLVLGGTDYAQLSGWRDKVIARMESNRSLTGIDSDYRESRPQLRVSIERDRAADLGVTVEEIGRTLETMMGSRRVTTIVQDGEEYDVMLQAELVGRQSAADLANTYVRGDGGSLVQLANVVAVGDLAEAGNLNRFNRMRAITISAGLAPGYTLGEAMHWLHGVVREELPKEAQIQWKGEAREFQSAGSAILLTLALAIVVVYLVLAAQFESFIHPVVIMLTVPLAVLGALIGLAMTGGTLNLFSQIGIVMLVGLAAKNGILIVEFANQLRDAGRDVLEAITESARVRLRPILMTSAATIMGAVPLVVFGGPGSASRETIGVVVIFGVGFSTALSLLVVPAFYALLAPFTRSPDALAQQVKALQASTPMVDS